MHSASRPTIDSIAPSSANPGDTVILTGHNFNLLLPASPDSLYQTWVKFGNARGTATAANWVYESPTRLRATVPADAADGAIFFTRMLFLPDIFPSFLSYDLGENPRIGWYVVAQSPQTFTVLPVAPTNLIATALGCDGLLLRWAEAGTNQTGFRISFREGNSPWTPLMASVPANAREEYIYDAIPSTHYEFRISALKGLLMSDASNLAAATTTAKPSVSIDLGTNTPSPFLDSGPVGEIVSFHAYYDSNKNRILDLAPTSLAVQDAYFPRFIPSLGEAGAGYPQIGNRFLPGSNIVVIVKFRTHAGRPIQYAAVYLWVDDQNPNQNPFANNGAIVTGPMYAGDLEVTGNGAVILFQTMNPPQVVTQPFATVVSGSLNAFVSFEVPDVSGQGIINAATVMLSFNLAVEPETRFTSTP
jgi:hypothetical protein